MGHKTIQMKTIPSQRGVAFAFALLLAFSTKLSAQTGSWQLWASGLPAGVYPKLAVAPNHDILYCLLGTGGAKGIIYKANTQSNQGSFTALPAVPLPASLVNNITALETNQFSEPIAGIFRNNVSDPWLFRFDQATQQWVAAAVDQNPTLGAFCMARAPNGDLWVGAKWAYVYKSTDNGHIFNHIDESAIVKAAYPCYYPSWTGDQYDGAIYGINVDKNGRVYAGTESAGMLYSDDAGLNWRPAEAHPCKDADPTQKDSSSAMLALSMGGNCSGIGFTADQKMVWCGANMWALNWPNKLGLADFTQNTVTPCLGLPQYLVQTGQQVSKIVTASNGQMFLHSGGNASATGIGIYTSMDGEYWTEFNNGITGLNDNQSQGSLAVDSNQVFMATHDGKIWRYVVPQSTAIGEKLDEVQAFEMFPNPAVSHISIHFKQPSNTNALVRIYDVSGRKCLENTCRQAENKLDISNLSAGTYIVEVLVNEQVVQQKLLVQPR